MYPRQIFKVLTEQELKNVSKFLHQCFPLVKPDRIYDLILQVDSIDSALHLLACHKESDMTLDSIVFDFMHFNDNKY